ncbi:MAG: tyrosine-type recombinase/integrase [Gammaproteobacteria bacterium]|nr:tyrosine-type recombinase/integrase [Gammaproteobacteria bacterium]
MQPTNHSNFTPWNKGKLIGQRPALKLQEVWQIRIRLQISGIPQELALFNLAIDSKLRSCDLVRLKVSDISKMGSVSTRAMVLQRKTQVPVQFEITPGTRDLLNNHLRKNDLALGDYLFKSRLSASNHLSTRQYARIAKRWVSEIGLDPSVYATHSTRRTKASLIYKRTKNLRAVQLLLGHTKLESTVRYLGVEVDDALELAEQTEV